MTRTKTLVVIGCLVAAAAAWHLLSTARRAGAQPPRGRQKWEYATLIQVFPKAQPAYRGIWRTGKKRLVAETRDIFEGVSRIYKDLAGHDLGKDEKAPFGALLDRIGHDGWELVTYAPQPSPEGNTETWTFKRPVP